MSRTIQKAAFSLATHRHWKSLSYASAECISPWLLLLQIKQIETESFILREIGNAVLSLLALDSASCEPVCSHEACLLCRFIVLTLCNRLTAYHENDRTYQQNSNQHITHLNHSLLQLPSSSLWICCASSCVLQLLSRRTTRRTPERAMRLSTE